MPVTLEEASARRPGDFSPALAGGSVRVRGRISAGPVNFQEYAHLAIQDSSHGLVVEAPVSRFEGLAPGEEIEVAGEIALRGGMPVLRPSSLRVIGRSSPPLPQKRTPDELQSFRHLGQLVVTEGRVLELVETITGAYLLIGSAKKPYKVFIPYAPGAPGVSFAGVAIGDYVRATGIASQYCLLAPYNRWFQLLAARPADVVAVDRRWFIPPEVVAAVLLAGALAGVIWWSRERRLRGQREMLRRAYQLGEEILGASSSDEILRRVRAVLPSIFGITQVHLYVYNVGARSLEAVPSGPESEPLALPLSPLPGGAQAAVVACFQNRTSLAVPDTSRSPFPLTQEPGGERPRSLLCVPMFAQGEVVGVFAVEQHDRTREFTADEQALAQHLGNQIGVAIRLLDQRAVREQLFRTEKLAAIGRLISGLVNELQAPLASIAGRAENILSDPNARPERELPAISSEARRAAEIVARLVCFDNADQVQAKPVELNALLRSLLEFRDREWKARGIRVRELTRAGPLLVLGSQGQLEQVFLNLLVFAEQSLSQAAEKLIVLRTSLLASRVLLEISFSGPRDGADPFARWSGESAGALGLGVCRSIIAGHGGDVRLVRSAGADPRFEIELPWARQERMTVRTADRSLRHAGNSRTALLMEPDESLQRQMLASLAGRGYRVVPVQNSDVGLELAQRLHFDVVFCSVHVPGLNWVELSEQLHSRVGGFILLSDRWDPELQADFGGEGRYVLPKPVDDQQLDRVLQSIEGALTPPSMLAGRQ
jgi:signal transduction histidine kinase/CheY-like chemotaxis protein